MPERIPLSLDVWAREMALQHQGGRMFWLIVAAMVLVCAVLVYCMAMSTDAGYWLKTRRQLLGRDRITDRE